jgi:hypothetical protein
MMMPQGVEHTSQANLIGSATSSDSNSDAARR